LDDLAQLVEKELKLVPPQFRELEPELYSLRWFDYRRMLPSRATQLFVKTYDSQYRAQYAKTQDAGAALTLKVAGVADDIFKSGALLQFWRARQEADRIGCRYPFYLRFVFDRMFQRGWRYLPRPNQLFDDDISLDVEVAWLEAKRQTLQLAKSPIFLAANYCGLPEQDAYYLYLVQQVQARPAPARVLARLVYKDKMLPESVAIEHFGADLIQQAFFHHNL